MARRVKPGWYPADDGSSDYWDGERWTGAHRPPAPNSPAPGWIASRGGLYHWWNGAGWTDAVAAQDGRVDVANNVGQTVISVAALGKIEAEAISQLQRLLRSYPPCKVEQLSIYHSSFAAGTNVVAVVSWDGPTAS